MYQILSESASFLRYDKTFWCVFRLTVSTAVHLQNANAKFHKVVYRHYLGEVENVYISVWQIYSVQYVPNFIGIGRVLKKRWQKHFGVFFSVRGV